MDLLISVLAGFFGGMVGASLAIYLTRLRVL
jgi:hypothetical protein